MARGESTEPLRALVVALHANTAAAARVGRVRPRVVVGGAPAVRLALDPHLVVRRQRHVAVVLGLQ